MFALNLRRRLALIICPELVGLTLDELKGESEERSRWLKVEGLHIREAREQRQRAYGMFDVEVARKEVRCRRLDLAAGRVDVAAPGNVIGCAMENDAPEAVAGAQCSLGLGA